MPTAAQIRNALDRVLASPEFAASERMCRFLRFVVERQMRGQSADLKEYTIGVEVFDRDNRYDPRMDPIVRVEARRLRSKLRSYYDGAGRQEDVLIELPKGTYVPVFRLSGRSAGAATTAAGAAPAPAPAAEPTARTIAVLPFENLSREPDADYLSDGLTQQIIHQLTRVRGLRVVGWSSAARMRERRDIYEVARELHASTMLVGSVRSGAGRLRITAQMIDAANGEFLWSEFYDRPVQDLLAIEEEISRSIVDSLQVQFGIVRASTGSPEAYALYYQGRYHWSKRTAEGFRKAVALFRLAIDLDANFALAWAGLADAYLLMADYGLTPANEIIETARKAAEQALRLSPCLGEAEATLALIRCLHDWEWDDAAVRFRRAMDLNPGYTTAFHWYAVDYCALRNRMDEARTYLAQALELDPLASIIHEGRGYIEMLSRRYEQAIEEHRKLIAFDPSFHKAWSSLGRAQIQAGNYDDAIESLERARSLVGPDHPSIYGALGQAYALKGNPDRAREMLGLLTALPHASVSSLAAIHIGLGEHRQAVEWMKRGCERRDLVVAQMAVHPLYDPLRTDPEFNAMVDRVGALR